MGSLVLFKRNMHLKIPFIKELNHNELLNYQPPYRLMQVSIVIGWISMLNSGGVSKGTSDFKQAIRAAIINKRAGGSGIIWGEKLFSVL
jgi:DhnA family fructose-bisphosphate aldolase class Ia